MRDRTIYPSQLLDLLRQQPLPQPSGMTRLAGFSISVPESIRLYRVGSQYGFQLLSWACFAGVSTAPAYEWSVVALPLRTLRGDRIIGPGFARNTRLKASVTLVDLWPSSVHRGHLSAAVVSMRFA